VVKPARGEVWFVNLDPTTGREQAGRRPALVVSVNELNQSAADLIVVLPITSRDKQVRSHVPVDEGDGGLTTRSFIKCEDIRSISVRRLERRLGSLSTESLEAVEDRLRILLGL
jgi:mRNA interferase MazF